MRRFIFLISPLSPTKFWTFFLFFIFTQQAGAQVSIQGKVTGSTGNPISGINIRTASGSRGTTTDNLGQFQLQLDASTREYKILFTGIGYKTKSQTIHLDSSNSLNLEVQLIEDILNLDAVVVTGTGIETSKKVLGNSISTINEKDMVNSGTGHLSGILNGKIMGGIVMQNSGDPAGGFSLKLRGVGSIFGSSEPLYLLDGVVIDNSSVNIVNLYLGRNISNPPNQVGTNRLVDINPNDIEHIEIINGPAAAAIYGSRAGNGVVQIFSKKGKKGKPEVVFTSSVNYNSVRNKLEFNESPYRFGVKTSTRLTNANEARTLILNPRTDPAPGGGPRLPNGKFLDTSRYPVTRYDYQDDIFQSSWGTDQHVSVKGGWERGDYYASVSYLNNDGIIKETNFTRYGLKFRSGFLINPWIKLKGGLTYNNSQSKEKPASTLQFSTIGTINHIDNVYDINELDEFGNLKAVEFGWVNPMSSVYANDIQTETDRTIADLNLELTPWKGFLFSGTIGMDTYDQQGTSFQQRLPYYNGSNVNLNLFPDGYAGIANFKYMQWTGDLTLSYAKNFSQYFTTSTVAGFSGQYIKNVFQSQEGRDLLPFIGTIGAAQNLFSAPIDQRSEQSVYGYFLQETIGYKNWLYLTLAGRFDGSSSFGSSAGNIFYPKASISANLSDLDFWQKNSIHNWFNTVKLRAAFGKAGNLTGIGPYDRFTNYPGINYYTGGIVPQNRQGNESIRPEVKTEWEAGMEMQFFNGRLFGRFNIYHQQISDVVVAYNWAPSNGSFSILDNIGEMENKGFEINIGGSLIRKDKFTWDASILINRNKNRITSVYNNTSFVGLDFQNTQGIINGYPMGVYYGFYYARNPDGTLLLNNNNGYLLPQLERGNPDNNQPMRNAEGQPTGTQLRKVLGDPNPDYASTLINEFSYKKWRLRIQIDALSGFEVFNWAGVIRNNIGNGKGAERELNGELTRGWSAAIGGFINGPIIHEEFVEDGSFIKVREVSLSYALTGIKGIAGLEFALTGRNLFVFTDYTGYDPETNSAGQSYLRGLDFAPNPIPRVIQASIIARF